MWGGQNTGKGMGGGGEEGDGGARRRTERRLKWREGWERGREKEVGESQGPFWEEGGG